MDTWTIVNAEILSPVQDIAGGYVKIEGGRIADMGTGAPKAPGRVVDAGGALLAPGLIDIHIHGSGGHWGFFEADDIIDMARFLARHGVTAFCPTTVSLPHTSVMDAIRAVCAAMEKQSAGRDYARIPDAPPETGARILGINIEGPYINEKMRGAHAASCIRPPVEKELNELFEAAGGDLRIMTVAPEIEGGMALVERLASRGVVASIGHSDATAAQAVEAVSRGARLATHLFNQHRAFHHREPGVAFTLLQTPGVMCELIADGVHVHPEVVRMAARLTSRMAARTVPDAEIILITDALSAAGLPPGEYQVWGMSVKIEDGVAKLPDGTIAGSTLTLNRAVANMAAFAGMSLQMCSGMASYNPAALLGLLPHAGIISPGAAADIALFDANMNCLATVIAGHTVYCADSFVM